MLISSGNALTDTSRNNVLTVHRASLSWVKFTHKMNHHSSVKDSSNLWVVGIKTLKWFPFPSLTPYTHCLNKSRWPICRLDPEPNHFCLPPPFFSESPTSLVRITATVFYYAYLFPALWTPCAKWGLYLKCHKWSKDVHISKVGWSTFLK